MAQIGACGLSLESILRSLLLKQILKVSYRKLAFHLCDSPTYRSIARLRDGQTPSHSALQGTVVKSNILDPKDSQLLDDGVRVLSRLMFQSKQCTGAKFVSAINASEANHWHFAYFTLKRLKKRRFIPHCSDMSSSHCARLARPSTRFALWRLWHKKGLCGYSK